MSRKIESLDTSRAVIVVTATFGLLGWEGVAYRWDYAKLLISSPSRITHYLVMNYDHVARAWTSTAAESSVGLAIATLIALFFALLFFIRPRLAVIIYPWILVSQVVPFIAIAPLIILLFGPTSIWGKIALATLVTFFPILNNLLAGIKSIPTEYFERMILLGATRFQVIRFVVAPKCTRFFFAGIRTAVPLAVIGAIVAEFNGATHGAGKDIFIAAKRLEPELMMCGLFSGALVAVVLYLAVLALERSLGPWYSDNKQ